MHEEDGISDVHDVWFPRRDRDVNENEKDCFTILSRRSIRTINDTAKWDDTRVERIRAGAEPHSILQSEEEKDKMRTEVQEWRLVAFYKAYYKQRFNEDRSPIDICRAICTQQREQHGENWVRELNKALREKYGGYDLTSLDGVEEEYDSEEDEVQTDRDALTDPQQGINQKDPRGNNDAERHDPGPDEIRTDRVRGPGGDRADSDSAGGDRTDSDSDNRGPGGDHESGGVRADSDSDNKDPGGDLNEEEEPPRRSTREPKKRDIYDPSEQANMAVEKRPLTDREAELFQSLAENKGKRPLTDSEAELIQSFAKGKDKSIEANAAILSRKILASGVTIPKNYKEAMDSVYESEWRAAINTELGAIIDKRVWEDAETSAPNSRVLDTKYVFTIKKDPTGVYVIRFKARLVVRPFGLLPFGSTDAAVAETTSVRWLISEAAAKSDHLRMKLNRDEYTVWHRVHGEACLL